MNDFIKINNFRNYDNITLELSKNNDVFVITGLNGNGKTNLLEAISIFSDGRGLRHANSQEMVNSSSGKNCFSVMLEIDSVSFFCGYDNGKRIYKINDKKVKNLTTFSKKYYVLWMTYETDRLLVESPSKRRAFIDMFCCAKFNNHEEIVKKYEKLAKERLKIIKKNIDNINDAIDNWLNIIEKQMVELGHEIILHREKIAKEIELDQNLGTNFPQFKSCMSDIFQQNIDYLEELSARRQKDFYTNSTTFGPNRTDWLVTHCQKNIAASYCSAGEQKMLLLGAFINFIKNNIKYDSRSLILLFDDVIAHLDKNHRQILFVHIIKIIEYFKKNNMQIKIFLTGIDAGLFTDFTDAVFYNIDNGKVFKKT